VWDVADRLGLEELIAKAQTSTRRHFSSITSSPAWLSVPFDRVQLIIGSDRVAANEEIVYNSLVAWLHAQSPSVGDDAAAMLFGLVRFPILSHDFVRNTVRKEPLLKTLAGMEVLNDAFELKAYGVESPLTRPRRMFEHVYVIGGTTGDAEPAARPSALVQRFDVCSLPNASWEDMQSMPTARSARAAVLNGAIYMISGITSTSPPTQSTPDTRRQPQCTRRRLHGKIWHAHLLCAGPLPR
jgi:hypothetical protein